MSSFVWLQYGMGVCLRQNQQAAPVILQYVINAHAHIDFPTIVLPAIELSKKCC